MPKLTVEWMEGEGEGWGGAFTRLTGTRVPPSALTSMSHGERGEGREGQGGEEGLDSIQETCTVGEEGERR